LTSQRRRKRKSTRSSAIDRPSMGMTTYGPSTRSPFIQCKSYLYLSHVPLFDVPANVIHRYHTFASAGSDGLVSIWDHTAKKRLRQYPKYHNAINAVSFNKTGTKLAVGVSYGWDKGQEGARLPENNRVSIFVREVGDEVKVRHHHKVTISRH
jgi:cell cycle arrest protein BUB3